MPFSPPRTAAQLQADSDLTYRQHTAATIDAIAPVVSTSVNQLAGLISEFMDYQGFWESENKGEKIALMHSELSEMLEAVRKGDEQNEAEELADTIIRLLDYAGHFGIDVGAAIDAKMTVNLKRPRKHGKAF